MEEGPRGGGGEQWCGAEGREGEGSEIKRATWSHSRAQCVPATTSRCVAAASRAVLLTWACVEDAEIVACLLKTKKIKLDAAFKITRKCFHLFAQIMRLLILG